jgi:hypothetical protein
MSRALIRGLQVLSASLGLALTSLAADAPDYRPCTRADLIGIWNVARLEPGSGTTAYRAAHDAPPYQWYVFYGNGTMRHITSAREITPSDYRTRARVPVTTTWRLDGRGGLTLDRTASAEPEWALCTVILMPRREGRTASGIRPGDVVLTYFRSNQIAMAHHLRRVRAE